MVSCSKFPSSLPEGAINMFQSFDAKKPFSRDLKYQAANRSSLTSRSSVKEEAQLFKLPVNEKESTLSDMNVDVSISDVMSEFNHLLDTVDPAMYSVDSTLYDMLNYNTNTSPESVSQFPALATDSPFDASATFDANSPLGITSPFDTLASFSFSESTRNSLTNLPLSTCFGVENNSLKAGADTAMSMDRTTAPTPVHFQDTSFDPSLTLNGTASSLFGSNLLFGNLQNLNTNTTPRQSFTLPTATSVPNISTAHKSQENINKTNYNDSNILPPKTEPETHHLSSMRQFKSLENIRDESDLLVSKANADIKNTKDSSDTPTDGTDPTRMSTSPSAGNAEEGAVKKRYRRRPTELNRGYECVLPGCERRYEAWRSLQHHLRTNHGVTTKVVKGCVYIEENKSGVFGLDGCIGTTQSLRRHSSVSSLGPMGRDRRSGSTSA